MARYFSASSNPALSGWFRPILLKNSDGQKFAFGFGFGFGKPFSKRGVMQTGFGNRSLTGIVFCPIWGIGLMTEFFNGIGPLRPLATKSTCCDAAQQTGRWCRAQQFHRVNDGCAGLSGHLIGSSQLALPTKSFAL